MNLRIKSRGGSAGTIRRTASMPHMPARSPLAPTRGPLTFKPFQGINQAVKTTAPQTIPGAAQVFAPAQTQTQTQKDWAALAALSPAQQKALVDQTNLRKLAALPPDQLAAVKAIAAAQQAAQAAQQMTPNAPSGGGGSSGGGGDGGGAYDDGGGDGESDDGGDDGGDAPQILVVQQAAPAPETSASLDDAPPASDESSVDVSGEDWSGFAREPDVHFANPVGIGSESSAQVVTTAAALSARPTIQPRNMPTWPLFALGLLGLVGVSIAVESSKKKLPKWPSDR